MISEKAYRDLEKIVGPENISREPAVLDGYAWQTLMNESPMDWLPRPAAVILPASTEEVQAIVKACNRHGVKYKAISTGWGGHASPGSEGVVTIDLRRLDRILELDEKNMYAVVEPYVCGAVLQAEAQKVGLNCHIIGAGPAHSCLASATSMQGMGWDSIYMSHSSRNVLGVEWVLPDGEILRLGTLGSGKGWYCGDGPGPSLRGIMRGNNGALGGFGVFTKCALKLYNWPGPPRIETEGLIVNCYSKVPENFEFHFCFFPDNKNYSDAVYRIGDSEIGYSLIRLAIGSPLYALCPHLFKKFMTAETLKDVLESLKYAVIVALVGNSQAEMDFQRHVLEAILRDTRGFRMDSSRFTQLGSLLVQGFLRASVVASVFRLGGAFMSAIGSDDALDKQASWYEDTEEIKDRWISKQALLDDARTNPFILSYENNTTAHSEEIYMYDPREERYTAGLPAVSLTFLATHIEHCMENLMSCLPHVRKMLSPIMGNFNHWQKQILQAFDPNGVSDDLFYTAEVDFDLSLLGEDVASRLQRALREHGGDV